MAIPVPAGTDAPCDFSEDWCATAAAINAKIAAYQQTLARVYPAIPVALLRRTEPITIGSLVPVPFTEVVFDTAGMTDLDAEPTVINVKRSGRFTIRGWFVINTTGVAQTIITARIATSTPAIERNGTILDMANYPFLGDGIYETVCSLSAGNKMQLMQASSGSLTINAASLCVAWHSDQERPI